MELSHDQFRDILNHQKESLQSLCKEWKMEIESNPKLPEDIIGEINVSTGKSELLIRKRFSQFFNLINDSEFKRSEKEITLQDLQGFWDIIFSQVEMIKNNFEKLSNLKLNSWKSPPTIQLNNAQRPQGKRPLTLHNKTAKVKCIGAARSSIRDHILAQRKKLKLEVKMDENTEPNRSAVGEIKKQSPQNGASSSHEANQSAESPDMKKFEAGFFKIHTPVQKIHSRPTIRNKLDLTPVSASPKVLASSALKKRVQQTPVSHKDYSPCMRITRSMKKSSLLNRQLGEAPA